MAPDNKIYIISRHSDDPTGYNLYNINLNVINYSNNEGLSCDFDTLTISLNNHIASNALPNMPNYNLGALAGSECDTLGTAVK